LERSFGALFFNNLSRRGPVQWRGRALAACMPFARLILRLVSASESTAHLENIK
jgi:hypothetical protein